MLSVFVAMVMVAMIMVMVVIVIFIMMVVLMAVLVCVDVELHALNAGLVFARGMDVVFVEAKFGQLALQLFQRDAEIDQRAVEHVTADAAKNIEVECFHFDSFASATRVLIWLAA